MNLKEQIIELYNKDIEPLKIAKILKIYHTTVYKNLKNVPKNTNITTHTGPKYKVDPGVIIKMYKSGKDCYEIAKIFSIDPKTVWYHLNKLGIVRPRGTTVNKSVNYNYFNVNMLGQESAYWLGFIFGDGNISKNRLTIALAFKEKPHLEILKNKLNISSALLYKTEPSTSFNKTGTICETTILRVSNKNIISDLKYLGVKENKTYYGGNPINVPNNLISSVILGFLDSDGWTSISKDDRYHIGWCGHFDNMAWISDNIYKFLNIKLKIYKKKNIYSLSISDKNKISKIAKWLLDNSQYSLHRKRIKLEKFVIRDLESSETRDERKQ